MWKMGEAFSKKGGLSHMDLLIQIPNSPFVFPGRVKRGPGIQNRERAGLDSGFSYAAPE